MSVLALSLACVRATRPAQLSVDQWAIMGKGAAVKIDVPRDWIPLAPSPARAEFIGPDRRSRLYLRAMPASSHDRSCTILAKQYSAEVIDSWGGPPHTRVLQREAGEGQVDFELQRSEPKPHGELIFSRVLCREGVLAVVSCAGPTPEEEALRSICSRIIASLTIAPTVSPTAKTAGQF